MIIPLWTELPSRRRVMVTPLLVGINIAAYALMQAGAAMGWWTIDEFLARTMLNPREPGAVQAITCMFTHDPGSLWHILFNMIFLWVFGQAVEQRLGRIGFAAFYLLGGLAATGGHVLVSRAPIIGASGAIAAVVGAFLALAPRSSIVALYLFTLSLFRISSAWLISLYFLLDVVNAFTTLFGAAYDIAYMAHVAGYVFGFGAAFALLGAGWVKREDVDVFFLFKQWRRRAALRVANRYAPTSVWESAQADTAQRLAKAKKADREAPSTDPHAAARADIQRLASAHDLKAAAAQYRMLLQQSPDAVLGEQTQLDLANQLYAMGHHADAAKAYELFLKKHAKSFKADEVRLMLGVCYARRLNQPQRARDVLKEARPRLVEQGQAALADQLLAELA